MTCATHLAAQRLQDLPIGKPIRLETCTGKTLTGKFGGLRGDSVDVAIDSVVTSTVTFPPDRITIARTIGTDCVRSYSVFERYASSAGRGALIGAGLGAVVVGVAWASDRAYERQGGAASIPTTALAVPVALVLTGIGAWIGAVSGTEQWSTPQRIAVDFRPMPGGNLSALSVRF